MIFTYLFVYASCFPSRYSSPNNLRHSVFDVCVGGIGGGEYEVALTQTLPTSPLPGHPPRTGLKMLSPPPTHTRPLQSIPVLLPLIPWWYRMQDWIVGKRKIGLILIGSSTVSLSDNACSHWQDLELGKS